MRGMRHPRRQAGLAATAVAVVTTTVLLGSCALGPGATPTPGAGVLDLAPRIANRPAGGDAAWIDHIPAGSWTLAEMDLAAHARAGGPARPVGGDDRPIKQGQRLVILGNAVTVDGTAWLRVYVVPRQRGADIGVGDVFTWVPATRGGRATLSAPEAESCPPTRDNLSTLGALDPFTRARCLGAATVTVEGRTARAYLPSAYDAQPPWLEPWGPEPLPLSLWGLAGGAVEVHFPPGLALPPLDITVQATLHVADPASLTCTRSAGEQDGPAEAASDSRLWCAVQLVVDSWQPVLGSEGRPFDPASPQLHRSHLGGACAGVGMGTVTFHTDPNRLEPVWAEADGGARSIMVWFGPEFSVSFQPDLVVVDADGRVVVRNGLTVDTDADLAGHFLCPTMAGLFVS
jgi:hypothetical protein